MGDEDIIPAAEIKRHNSKGDLWLTIHGNVYDVSDFMTEHPGGEDALLSQAELDATDAFEDVGHSRDARALLETFEKGKSDKMQAVSIIHQPAE
ncbi:hypothetical protein FANTH_14586 [Fusarium anthophilum]|uniref:Cytochrome b5 heme-binding domain-containing protein n=1 Tax=Fusarium anthophilum TaxID=48485 RepID=A0A8H5DLL8_9HYPO|nr:hypothetical protein FANTH_14586 [Fusarium anthophilum]